MADIYIKQKVDDLDGHTPATQVVRFGYNRKNYLIDLNDEHADELKAFIVKHIRAGRRDAPNRNEKKPDARVRNANIRAWAADKGIEVSETGRIPDAIKTRYALETGL